jgi:hypothetical protein
MNHYSDVLEENTLLFSQSRIEGFSALSKGLLSFNEENPEEVEALEILESQLLKLLDVHLSATKGLIEFRMTIAELPRSTVVFNASKQKALASMDKFFTELNSFRETTENILVSISELKNKATH